MKLASDTVESEEKKESKNDQDKSPPEASKNILCEPISPEEYKLQHRKSVHEYFNPELL